MPRPLKHSSPLQSKTMRLSERHRFKLSVIANLRGESEATLTEQMIDSAGADTDLGKASWDTLWDEEEAVRWLNVFALPGYRAKKTGGGAGTEENLLRFIFAHAQFFWTDTSRTQVRRAHAIILWPHRWELEKKWRTTRDQDYHAAAKDMAKRLEKVGLKVPAFG